MILVDTGIIIDFWKKPNERMKEVFLKEDIAICGIIKAELMHGAPNEEQLKIIKDGLSELNYFPVEESLWENVGNMLYRLRKKGITVPIQDIIISILSIKHNLPIWSKDEHFKLIQKEFKELKLFTLV